MHHRPSPARTRPRQLLKHDIYTACTTISSNLVRNPHLDKHLAAKAGVKNPASSVSSFFSLSAAHAHASHSILSMDIVLTHFTALEALRSPSLRKRLAKGQRCDANLPDRPPTKEELTQAMSSLPDSVREIDMPEILLDHDAPRSRPRHVKTHRAISSFPSGSAVELAPGVRCVSPEHLVVQLAAMLTELEIVCLLSEMLGTYAIAPGLEKGMFSRDQPLTTPELIKGQLEQLGPVAGTAKTRRALKMACVRSASPRETKLSLRMGLSKARGGYGFEVLSMNDPVEVQRIHDSMRTGVRKPDILLRAPGDSGASGVTLRGVALEYDGRDHEGAEQHAADVERHNELTAKGFNEYVVTRRQYADLDYMDGLAEAIRRDLGIRKVRVTRAVANERRCRREKLWHELEGIDGVNWSCLTSKDEGERDPDPDQGDDGWDEVPVEAYGFE